MFCFFFFKQKTAYEMRISDWSSDVCSSDLLPVRRRVARPRFDTNVELHFRNGREQIALNINGQGLERGNIKGVKPLGTCSDQVRQYRQKTRQRLACARGGGKQSMLSGLRCRKHVQLMEARSPAPVRKPEGKGTGQGIIHPRLEERRLGEERVCECKSTWM